MLPLMISFGASLDGGLLALVLLILAASALMAFGMAVDTTTYLADLKIVYGALRDQIATQAIIMNLFGDGTKFGKPVSNIGGGTRGYQFLARCAPNWRMGFRPEGTTGVGTAGQQGLKNSTVLLKYAYVPIVVTGQAENLTKGEQKAFMQAKALEVKFDMKDIVSHVNVVVAGAERGGALAIVAAAPAPGAGTFTADNAGGLPGAMYLRVGMPIDTGAVGGGALTCDASAITAIDYPTGAVTHTTGTAVAAEAVTLGGEHAITSGTYPYTCEGLVSLVADTGAIQGLNPATSGEEAWQSYELDNSGNDLSAQLIHQLRQFVKSRGGEEPDFHLFPCAQVNTMAGFATQNLRFDVTKGGLGKKALELGFTVLEFAGQAIVEDKDLRPDRIYAGASDTIKKFEALPLGMAEDEAGAWTRVTGASGVADAVSGLLRWYFQIGTIQRSAWGVLKGLSVPDGFQSGGFWLPPTI